MRSKVAVLLLVAPIVGLCVCSMFGVHWFVSFIVLSFLVLSFLVLQIYNHLDGKESWLLYFVCLSGVL